MANAVGATTPSGSGVFSRFLVLIAISNRNRRRPRLPPELWNFLYEEFFQGHLFEEVKFIYMLNFPPYPPCVWKEGLARFGNQITYNDADCEPYTETLIEPYVNEITFTTCDGKRITINPMENGILAQSVNGKLVKLDERKWGYDPDDAYAHSNVNTGLLVFIDGCSPELGLAGDYMMT